MNFLTGKRLIIFDCDGVLIDANQANINFFNECLKRGGYPPLPEDLHEKVVYQSTKQLMFELFPDPAEAGRMHQISQETDYTPFLDDVRPLFDYGRVLGALRKRFSLAVATNRGRSLDRLFKHFSLDTWFEYRVSVLEAEPKPHPEMLLKCVEHFNVPKSEAIYLGDSITDREAAINAGIDYLWVGRDAEPGIGSVSDLADYS
ncbi:MAG TPA: HAD family hydrolase [Spirochaetota bacterium]|nr:HAD family hydrolase [Spirochaetota bacterium]HPN13140.1 HAD family hydrolase [Spirochaetota bacterium]